MSCISSSFYAFFAKPTTPFLLSALPEPILRRTAASERMTKSSHKTVRIVWVSSMISLLTPKGGINFNEVDNPSVPKVMNNYTASKSGDAFLAAESAKKLGNDGILSVVSTHAE